MNKRNQKNKNRKRIEEKGEHKSNPLPSIYRHCTTRLKDWKKEAASLEEKKKVQRDGINPSSYYDSEHTKNVKDWKELLDFQCKDPTLVSLAFDENDDRLTEWSNPSPQYPSNLGIIIQEYVEEIEKLAYKLMELIALSLGVEAKRFKEFFKDQTSFIRFNHYPPCPYPHLTLGIGRHKDAGALTILAQDEVKGLEVKRKTDQQ
ncbi:protein DMR6-LIKE OXYGENASE [Trifolium repens]|nr:protein DMR6-LIKE OXYGENASE [Trifolium repens]